MAEKNALAELAERLKWLCGEVYCTIGHDEADDIRKARRIVSELAKANPDRWPMCVQAVIDCRTIAEEGASDGAEH